MATEEGGTTEKRRGTTKSQRRTKNTNLHFHGGGTFSSVFEVPDCVPHSRDKLRYSRALNYARGTINRDTGETVGC